MNEYKIKKRKKCARTLGNMEKGKGEGAHTQRGNENTWWGVKRIIHRTGTSAQWRRSFWKIIIRQIAVSHEAKMRKYCSSIVPLYHNLHHHHIYLKPRWNTRNRFWNITSNTRKLMLLLFSSVWNPDETRSTSFWNYFSNKRKLV